MINKFYYIPVVATNHITESEAFKGVKLLLTDLTTAFMILGALVVVASIVMQLIKAAASSPEEAPKYVKHTRTVLIIGISIFLVGGLFKLILTRYWKVDIDTGKTTQQSKVNDYTEDLNQFIVADKVVYINEDI